MTFASCSWIQCGLVEIYYIQTTVRFQHKNNFEDFYNFVHIRSNMEWHYRIWFGLWLKIVDESVHMLWQWVGWNKLHAKKSNNIVPNALPNPKQFRVKHVEHTHKLFTIVCYVRYYTRVVDGSYPPNSRLAEYNWCVLLSARNVYGPHHQSDGRTWTNYNNTYANPHYFGLSDLLQKHAYQIGFSILSNLTRVHFMHGVLLAKSIYLYAM